MTEQITTLIIDGDDGSRQFLKTLLRETRWIHLVAESGNLDRGYDLARQHKPAVVILNLTPVIDHALKVAQKITQNLPQTTLVITSAETKPELIIKAMRAGAREFLPQPLNRDDLLKALKNVRWKSQSITQDDGGGQVLTVFGVKGGVGTTTVATNLAVKLATLSEKDVVLVDLNLQLGNSALFLNVKPKYSIVDIANNIEEIDPAVIKNLLPKHPSGVYLLKGPPRIEEAESIRAGHIDQIVHLLKAIFSFVVIDTNDIFDELTLKILDESDFILTVFTAELPAVYNTRQCLEIFEKMHYSREKVRLIMNRSSSNRGLAFHEMEKTLDYPVFMEVPNLDYDTIVHSLNQGVPISILKPRSKLSGSFERLAAHFNGHGPSEPGQQVGARTLNPFKKLFRRNHQG